MAMSKARKIVEYFNKSTQQTFKASQLPEREQSCNLQWTWILRKEVTPRCYYKVVVILLHVEMLEVLEAGLDVFVCRKGDYM